MGGIGNKAQLRPAKAGAGAWPELGKKKTQFNKHGNGKIFTYAEIFVL